MKTDLVGRCLAGPGDVSGDLGLETLLAGGSVGQHVLQGLVLAPVQGVEARVHNQPAGSEYLLTQVAEPAQR